MKGFSAAKAARMYYPSKVYPGPQCPGCEHSPDMPRSQVAHLRRSAYARKRLVQGAEYITTIIAEAIFVIIVHTRGCSFL
jgi:hypothetical protein